MWKAYGLIDQRLKRPFGLIMSDKTVGKFKCKNFET